jgi:hypothetical protein
MPETDLNGYLPQKITGMTPKVVLNKIKKVG